ncbi:hypothetical protein MRB53_039330 [Persea americana]|nr:hypothetical protein MRB53_039330 [Persea americana]
MFNGKTYGDRELSVAVARPLQPRRKSSKQDKEQVETTSTDEAAPATEKKRSRKPRSKKSNGAAAPSSDEAELASGDTDPNVNGLDHKTTDAELLELFSAHNPTSAHVALRPIQRYMIKRLAEKGEQRLGRGFGFVTFADQAAQTKALEAMNGHKSG